MPRITSFQDGDTLEGLDSSFMDELVARSHPRPGSAASILSTMPQGGAHVLLASFGLTSDDAADFDVLESSIDWRDRLVVVNYAVYQPLPPVLHAERPLAFSSPTLWYSGPGQSDGASSGQWALPISIDGISDGHIVASSDDGALLLKDWLQGGRQLFMVLRATEQLGEHSSPPTPHTPNPVDGTAIRAVDINAAQDGGLLRQANQGRRGLDRPHAPGYTPRKVVALPFGPIATGDPPFPISQELDEKDGVYPPAKFEARQRLAGEAVRALATSVPNNDWVILDASLDWRDRNIEYFLQASASDIRPGEASDNTFGSQSGVASSFYSGKGHSPSSMPDVTDSWSSHLGFLTNDLRLFVDASTGNLVMRNEVGGTRHVAGFVRGSFRLGLVRV